VAEHLDNLKNVVVRLGRLHLLFSFLIFITSSKVMERSGLEEALSLIFAPKVIKIMSLGHFYLCVIMGYFLVYFILMWIFVESVERDSDKRYELQNVSNSSQMVSMSEISENSAIESLSMKMNEAVKKTVKLCSQCIGMINLLKNFIRAERSGDWTLHVKCLRIILPYLLSTGHHLYAKFGHMIMT